MSQRELAKIAGVPHSTVGRIEAGSVDPRVGTFAQLLRVLGYHVAVVDPLGQPLDPTEDDEPHDRAGRRMPAHLKIYRTPGYFQRDGPRWWGWERVAWPFGPGEPPAYTYRLRRRQRRNGQRWTGNPD